MKKLFVLIIFIFCLYTGFSQFGLSTPMYTGKDAKLMSISWGAQVQLFYPVYLPIKIKDSSKIFFLLQPALKFDWYNFKENLMVDRQNNFTSLTVDADANNIYNSKFLKTSSMMHSYSFYIPVNILLTSRKLKYFVFAPGFYVDYLVGGEFKRKYNNNSAPISITTKFKQEADFYGFQRFQYGLSGHISYKFITVYGIYSFTPLFKKTQGVDVRRYEVGLWFNIFWKKQKLKPY